VCGIYYSTDNQKYENKSLKRRGPEKWTQVTNDFGTFAHSLLSTIGSPTDQPILNNHGTLLYNGSTYNQKSNDTKWISQNLNDVEEQCVEFIRSLVGEYAIIYVTEKFVIFCSDVFSIRPLFFSADGGNLSIASLPDALSGRANLIRCEGNKIYVFDRQTESIQIVDNHRWNLHQSKNNYDSVFEMFEQAVADRHTENNMYTVSAGHDTGAIACCVQKQFGKFHGSFVYPNNEDKQVLAARGSIHKLVPVNVSLGESLMPVDVLNSMFMNRNSQQNVFATAGLSAIINTLMKPKGMKVLVMGSGGDELYADYAFAGSNLEFISHGRSSTNFSKFGGVFPADLNLVWPWHNHRQYQSSYVEKHEAVGGYWGIEVRCPLLDVRLVQAWISTTHTLKNKEYKGWMAEYMRQHDYPFGDKIKGIFSD